MYLAVVVTTTVAMVPAVNWAMLLSQTMLEIPQCVGISRVTAKLSDGLGRGCDI